MKRFYLLGLMIALLGSQAALAQTFSVKGVLRDPSGQTVKDGSYKLTLKLYTQETGGAEFWSEVHGSVQAQHGVFGVELGSVESLAGVGFGQTYWLGIQVEDQQELKPRILLGTHPYSLAVKGESNVFPSTGSVGINTLTPDPGKELDVAGDVNVQGSIHFSDGSSMSSADLGGTASGVTNPANAQIVADNIDSGSGEIQFLTGTSTDMVIRNDGSVEVGGNASIGGSLDVTSGANVGGALGVTSNTTVGGTLGVSGDASVDGNLSIAGLGATIELGAGVADKNGDAGKIGFRLFGDQLDIVGAGSNSDRRIRLWAEQGVNILGDVGIGGGALNPQITLALGDTDTGLHSIADGVMAWYSNGNERMRVAANGKVGIGTSTPNSNLSIAGLGSTIELGAGEAKQGDAGKIGFRLFGNQLDILGASDNLTDRRIKFWAEQGAFFTGYVGIGTDSPLVPLHVTGSPNDTRFDGGGRYYDNAAIGGAINGGDIRSNSIAFFNGDVISSDAFISADNPIVFSDQRTKRSHGRSHGDIDLETLMGIEITDYERIDPRASGIKPEKKVIAQQVVEVYPQAVSYINHVIPNVYAKAAAHDYADATLTVTTVDAHGFAIGDRVDLYTDKEDLVKVEVLAVDGDKSFSVAATEAPEHVFVYGKWVDDFHVVDYDALSMLNISATQELARRVTALERDKAALQAELERYQALEAMLEVRMERFEEAVLQRLEEQRVRPQRVDRAVVEDGGLSLAD